MSFLLDTDTCSVAMKERRRLFTRFNQYRGRIHTSRIVTAELYAWAYRFDDPSPRLKVVEEFITEITVLEFDDRCARAFGELRNRLRSVGRKVPAMDLLIASTAIVHDLTLVTHNTKDFTNIPGLSLSDWLAL